MQLKAVSLAVFIFLLAFYEVYLYSLVEWSVASGEWCYVHACSSVNAK
jgi:hypothetical protein